MDVHTFSNSTTWTDGTLTQTTWFVRKADNATCGTAYSNVIASTVRPLLEGGTIALTRLCVQWDPVAFTSSAPATGGSYQ